MGISLLNTYCSYHPDFLGSLEVFSSVNKNRILKKLKKERDKSNFLSIVAEIQFGKLFNHLGFGIEYDRVFTNNQTPDWVIAVDVSPAICDVYRLGMSERDQRRADFERQLIEQLELIRQRYVLRIHFVDEYFDTAMYDVGSIVNEVQGWLDASEKIVGDKISVQGNFKFEVRKTSTRSIHVSCNGNASSIDVKLNKLIQAEKQKPNEITKKLSKYNSIISELSAPYFICVSIDFISGVNHEDFVEHFLGHSVEFADFNTPLGNLAESRHIGQYWTELGEFYNNLQLSGIITLYNNVFRLLLNPDKRQVIYQDQYFTMREKLSSLSKDS